MYQLDVDFSKSRLAKCSVHGWEHILRANELRLFLERNPNIAGPVEPLGDSVSWNDLRGFHGIIFCGDFWGEYNTRDHIDLWNGERMGTSPELRFSEFIDRSKDTRFWRFP